PCQGERRCNRRCRSMTYPISAVELVLVKAEQGRLRLIDRATHRERRRAFWADGQAGIGVAADDVTLGVLIRRGVAGPALSISAAKVSTWILLEAPDIFGARKE